MMVIGLAICHIISQAQVEEAMCTTNWLQQVLLSALRLATR